ncbi:MAG: hypothetical protein ACOC2M_01820, partial [bacterium]
MQKLKTTLKYMVMKKHFTSTLVLRLLVVTLALLLPAVAVNAADYYWRAVAANNDFNNIGNWETAPGNGVTPAQAPGA